MQRNLESNGKLTKDYKLQRSEMLHDQLKASIQDVQRRREEYLRSKNMYPDSEIEHRIQEEQVIAERTRKVAFNKKHAKLMKCMFGFFYLTLFCNDMRLLIETSSVPSPRTKNA